MLTAVIVGIRVPRLDSGRPRTRPYRVLADKRAVSGNVRPVVLVGSSDSPAGSAKALVAFHVPEACALDLILDQLKRNLAPECISTYLADVSARYVGRHSTRPRSR
ncbi:hypothetical protein GCM10009530_24230 [Microbispora corallina]|uniref:Uncharacterized protein n=1 Tax=Microbispora corallina TaxID=83302 RepID=A0ABQ4G483_9ACTN|nr:hypothetical protein Mco01_49070 [Microbispora corallina]